MPRARTIVIIVIIVASSLAGGLYTGYQLGSNDTNTRLSPVIGQLNEQIANVTAENEALKKNVPSIAGRTVRIGYIAPETIPYSISSPPVITPALSTAKPFIEKIIQPDLNAYALSLGLDTRFEFVIGDAMGQPGTHLELVQKLHSSGVDIFIGGGWSSMAGSSLSYVNTRKMLMMSPTSTSPTLAFPNDRLFRMCPADVVTGPAIANIAWSYGVKELVVVQLGDAYGDGVLYFMVPEYERLGGAIAGKVRYPADATDYAEYLNQANTLAKEAIKREGNDTGRVGVLLLALDEAPSVLKQASQFEPLYSLTWFGGDTAAFSQGIVNTAPIEASHVKLFSPLAREPDAPIYAALEKRFVEATGSEFSIYFAYLYDAAAVLARTIIETGSDNATVVATALPGVCEDTYGVSGWLRLNGFGDRVPPPFDIWYYAEAPNKASEIHIAGTYNPETGKTVWYNQ